jgi:hypothetical protein
MDVMPLILTTTRFAEVERDTANERLTQMGVSDAFFAM